MFVVTLIVSVLLAAMLTMSAIMKITRRQPFVQTYADLGVPEDKLNYLAALLLAGAVGLIAGLWWPPIGIAAAIGVILYFIGAIIIHVRAKDLKNIGPPTVVLILAVAALMLRIASS